ncbi:MAG: hypothetical protein AUJ32_01180 [Parcubacteria group bacterium CG1_02_40_82]|uniref:Uncharacterized protein n=4 Tax=Candidatus Portnoyibacteriota TaxID=1817913 RepID=A0A2M7IHG0_9BACT|nr:MAG: hypothetical protein AUJ32_01180 [Parcubacteria group bacterium CG1_02_40_82]PIQ75645.1 MAG: hypothetical protein COV84_00080 [Candidatus Portnoybacteria bacterium CG11_big_fil_rev_8_21_14_0_20_40_15]PIS31369.1 MAG: hypothetical protein COT41_02045 [Candidatus Portnoybacteria bacterium CG08_land_8_20_14_0_20_40_83]PIW75963.1 MAG: hypothetical protein CO001_03905 [Candidatus Portnoybacteria bacterium CG_4_8_14_3_um_filter_40_10]PIY74790.1 MAG: hypothetical protein COY85_02190 [Candidatus
MDFKNKWNSWIWRALILISLVFCIILGILGLVAPGFEGHRTGPLIVLIIGVLTGIIYIKIYIRNRGMPNRFLE